MIRKMMVKRSDVAMNEIIKKDEKYMNKFGTMLILSLWCGTTMYGAQGVSTKKVPSSCQLTQECDQKVQSSEGASKIFWDTVSMYGDKGIKREKQISIVHTLRFMLEKNSDILSSTRTQFIVRTKKHKYKFSICYPLSVAAYLADDSDEGDPERKFFEEVVYLDTDNERRLHLLTVGIKDYSTYVVQQLLCAKTDVTRSPKIMQRIVDTCQPLSSEYLKKCEDYNAIVNKMKGKKQTVVGEWIDLHTKLEDLFSLKGKRYSLLGITHLLLEARADLTGVVIEKSHFKDKTCLGCQSIVNRMRAQATDEEQPGLALYQTASSSSSSHSSSAS
jgi:hypothetical protein